MTAPDRPEIEYPTRWTYKVIGEDESRLRAAIATIVGNREHGIDFSHASTQGKYVSLTLEVVVHDEDERNTIFGELGKHVDVKVVM